MKNITIFGSSTYYNTHYEFAVCSTLLGLVWKWKHIWTFGSWKQIRMQIWLLAHALYIYSLYDDKYIMRYFSVYILFKFKTHVVYKYLFNDYNSKGGGKVSYIYIVKLWRTPCDIFSQLDFFLYLVQLHKVSIVPFWHHCFFY